MNTLFTKILYEMEEQRDTMLVTIVDEHGAAPRGAGAQMLVGETGQLLGTVGGGPTEKYAGQLALQMLREHASGVRAYAPPTNDGSVCGGEVSLHFQFVSHNSVEWRSLVSAVVNRIAAKQSGWLILKLDGSLATLTDGGGIIIAGKEMWVKKELLSSGSTLLGNQFSIKLPIGDRAILFGAGHCTRALAPVLETVGFRTTIFDEREAFANLDRYPGAERIICGNFSDIDASITIEPNDYIVIMTSGHKFDLEVQSQVLRHPHAYCGVIGSGKKIAYAQQVLRERGIAEEVIQAVHTPIGLPIHSVTPEEIAVSIAGEMILERAKRRESTDSTSPVRPV